MLFDQCLFDWFGYGASNHLVEYSFDSIAFICGFFLRFKLIHTINDNNRPSIEQYTKCIYAYKYKTTHVNVNIQYLIFIWILPFDYTDQQIENSELRTSITSYSEI